MLKRLEENVSHVRERIRAASRRSGRDPESLRLIAVTKNASVDLILALASLGFREFGENKAQELLRKALLLRSTMGEAPPTPIAWHMIGHVQRNKVRSILPYASLIHSVDTLRLAEEISADSVRIGATTPILVQVNGGEEATKFGVAVAATTHFVEEIVTLPNLEVQGLMTMAPQTAEHGPIRAAFTRVKELFDEIVEERIGGRAFRELSMGMSGDLELGVECGATMLRVGSALFDGIELPAESIVCDADPIS